ncbi:hypothetical protein LCGC14_1353280 [marine sediment metagenome]|uniref:Uncharacterized protein n=1 Tax=marine sediment metagenome TaxID=412755 RepID=A0A0F9NCI6_9ZZZZ
MEEIIIDLKKILVKIEKKDDPTASEEYRDRLGEVHDIVFDCIEQIEEI